MFMYFTDKCFYCLIKKYAMKKITQKAFDYSINTIQDFFQIFLNLWQGTSPSLWRRKKRSPHSKSNKWRRPISNQHNTGITGLGVSRRERIQHVFSSSLSLKSKRRQRLKRSLSGLSDGLLGDNTHTVSSYHTSTSGYSGSGSGDYGSGSGDNSHTTSSHYDGGSGYFTSDGTWSYFQDYKEELTQYVQDEWNQRVSQFQEEFQKNPRYIAFICEPKEGLGNRFHAY